MHRFVIADANELRSRESSILAPEVSTNMDQHMRSIRRTHDMWSSARKVKPSKCMHEWACYIEIAIDSADAETIFCEHTNRHHVHALAGSGAGLQV